jgi:flagellar motor switch protein FliN
MTQAPLFWLKQIAGSLEELQEVPLWGFPPAFPFEACAEKIANILQAPELKITVEATQMRTASEIGSGLGAHFLSTTIELSPLSEPVYWLMAQEDVRKLCAAALSEQPNGVSGKGFTSSVFSEGFYRFLILQAASAIDELGAFSDLTVVIGQSRPIPKEEALCFDIGVRLPKLTVWGRLVCPLSFRAAFKEHFHMTASSLASPRAKEIELTVCAEVGRTQLSVEQFKKAKVGDFIVLDHCSYDPSTQKGTAIFSLNDSPLLRVRLKGDSVKIVDYAFYYEDTHMNEREQFSEEEPPPPENEEEHLWTSSESESNPVEQQLAAQDIQLSLTVEVARLKINLEKLLHLQPGNVLELPIRPEQGVDLSIGGKKMAKAELVKLGDILGVRILQLD